jgi:hypothetical protein
MAVIDMLDVYFDRLSVMPSSSACGSGSTTLLISKYMRGGTRLLHCTALSVYHLHLASMTWVVKLCIACVIHSNITTYLSLDLPTNNNCCCCCVSVSFLSIFNPCVCLDFRVSAFQQSYQGVYTNTSLPQLVSSSSSSSSSLAAYSSFLTQQFTARHAASLSPPHTYTSSTPSCLPYTTTTATVRPVSSSSRTSTNTTVYEGRVFLASGDLPPPSRPRARSRVTGKGNKRSSGGRRRKRRVAVNNDTSDSDEDSDDDEEKAATEGGGGRGAEGAKSAGMEEDEREREGGEERGEPRVVVSAVFIYTTSTTSTSSASSASGASYSGGGSQWGGQEEGGEEAAELEGVRGVADPIPLELWR